VLSTLAFALGPAMKLSRGNVIAHLKEHAGEDAVSRRWRLLPRHPLVVAQLAFSLALLTAAALFLRGANQAAAADSGLQTDRDFLVELDASLGGHDPQHARDIYRRLGERFAALPGVEGASIAIDVPFGGQDLEKQVRVADRTVRAKWNSVGADYFHTVGLPLLRGRAFTTAEVVQPGGPPVAIINDILARKLWPDSDALGQPLQLLDDDSRFAKVENVGSPDHSASAGGDIKPGETLTIVGIVPAIRHVLFEKAPDPDIYLPFARGFQSHVFYHVKFASLPAGTEGANAELLRRVVRDVDASLPVLSVKTFSQHLDSNVQIWMVRAGAVLFSIFGGLALGLAVVGVHGVVSYAVARRTREIGIRMALGARPDVVHGMILRESAMMLGYGLLIGSLLAILVGKLVGHLLYQVEAMDPIAFTIAPTVLAVAAFLACYLPARRATKVDPVVALRAE
jgi:predicted permease